MTTPDTYDRRPLTKPPSPPEPEGIDDWKGEALITNVKRDNTRLHGATSPLADRTCRHDGCAELTHKGSISKVCKYHQCHQGCECKKCKVKGAAK